MGLGKTKLSFKLPNVFSQLFLALCMCPLPHPISFLDCPGTCALLQSDSFPRLFQTSLFPLCGNHFGFYWACLIVLLHHLASTAHVLNKRNSSALSWHLLHAQSMQGISPHHFLSLLVNLAEQCRSRPRGAVRLSFLPSGLGRILSRMMPVTPWGHCDSAVSQLNQAYPDVWLPPLPLKTN